MTPRVVLFALIVILIALMWGAKDWIGYHWEGLTEGRRAAWLAGISLFLLFVVAWLLKPIFVHLFF